MDQLAGKTAVVTGAASGIGLGLSKRFAQEGMRVVMADIEAPVLEAAAAEVRAIGQPVASLVTDVRKPEALEALANLAYSEFGAVHVVCNNAGVQNRDGMVWEQPLDDWKWVFAVNVNGVINGMRSFVPRMLAGGEEGVIVNTASMAGLVTGAPGAGVYYASKHAVLSLTESLYRELAGQDAKITAAVVCPGAVSTNIFASERNRPDEYGEAQGAIPDGPAVMARQAASLGGAMSPANVAEHVVNGIRENRFYIFPAQDMIFGYVKMGHDRMWEGKNPAVSRRRPT